MVAYRSELNREDEANRIMSMTNMIDKLMMKMYEQTKYESIRHFYNKVKHIKEIE